MDRARVVLVTVIVALSVSSSLRAHHSFAAEFDANQPVTLKGTVVKMDWVNPHTWIHLDVKNPDGTVTRWMIEGGTPNTLVRRGFNKKSLRGGHGGHHRGISRQERHQPRQRRGHDPARRQAAVHGLVRHRRAERRRPTRPRSSIRLSWT